MRTPRGAWVSMHPRWTYQVTPLSPSSQLSLPLALAPGEKVRDRKCARAREIEQARESECVCVCVRERAHAREPAFSIFLGGTRKTALLPSALASICPYFHKYLRDHEKCKAILTFTCTPIQVVDTAPFMKFFPCNHIINIKKIIFFFRRSKRQRSF